MSKLFQKNKIIIYWFAAQGGNYYTSTMAKSLRSKVKKRFRALRRGYINEIKVKPET